MSRGTALQLKGWSGRSARSEARWMARASISLPVPVSPVSSTGSGFGGDAPGDVEQLGALLGGPDALGIAVEGLGRPQRGALLLVAAVAVEGARGGDQLADGRDGAVMFEVRPRPRQDLPGFVSVLTKDGKVVSARRLPRRRRAPRRRSSPRPNHPGAGRPDRDEGELRTARRRRRGSRTPHARGCAGVPPARSARRRCRDWGERGAEAHRI